MARSPGGPLSGGLEAINNDGLEVLRQNRERQETPRQEAVQQRMQDKQAPPLVDPEAAQRKNLEENERVAQRRISEMAERFGPKQQTPPDRQREQER
jgi:hypothetical protein